MDNSVYPRVCGGTGLPSLAAIMLSGLSRVCGGTIDDNPSCVRCGVYPRVCGGNLRPDIDDNPSCGSIPACAGEPLVCSANT